MNIGTRDRFDRMTQAGTRAVAVRAIYGVLIAGSLFASLKTVVGLFGIDADTVHSLILWQGVSEHGLPWIADWIFTQDNWLLFLMPFHFVFSWRSVRIHGLRWFSDGSYTS